MFFNNKSKKRPYHYGPFPLETLARDVSIEALEIARPQLAGSPERGLPEAGLAVVARQYREVFMRFRQGSVAKAKAPVPDDLERRAVDIKGGIYFLDAAHVGVCRIPDGAWLAGKRIAEHRFAIVIVVEKGRIPEQENPAHGWLQDAVTDLALTRAAGIAVNVANYIGALGYGATAHVDGVTDVDIVRLSVLAGVTSRLGEGVVSPYLEEMVLAAVTTEYGLAIDTPLAPIRRANRSFRYWLGINGAQSGRERERRAGRASHMSRYPMEQVRRVDRPTTLILDHEVPRVPKRASFFERALKGDLGPRTQRERWRFAYKHPSTVAYLDMIEGMVPLQEGEVNGEANIYRYRDPAANARAVKSLSYSLGADLTGICEIPRYAWYSHDGNGDEIVPYHRYAIVMLIDQGYETMEGASGDDWISGSQSMRAYMRGMEIAGMMANFLRSLGFSSRPQSHVDSHVLHIPLILWAGLGELSRIGELVLNPFVGPRFKSVVLTTDMPLAVDKPIDFGLQYFCSHCHKCARECPCDAIPVLDKVMFNGYEMWKIDAERCARYRLTNAKGSACGRCMKTCPLNKVPDSDGPLLHRIGSWLGVNVRWLKPLLTPLAVFLDDRLGYGMRNPYKKWWLDLEIINDVCVTPPAGVNQRDIDYHKKVQRRKEKIAYYHANMMPPPNDPEPYPVDRKAAKAAADLLETPAAAIARKAAGGVKPEHYIPTPPLKKKRRRKKRR